MAEAYLGPAYYVKALLARPRQHRADLDGLADRERRTPDRGRQRAHPGLRGPPRPRARDGGFVRSLVAKGLTAAELRAGASRRRRWRRRRPSTVGPSLAVDRDPVRRAVVRGAADRRHDDPAHAAARQRQRQADPRRRPGIGPLGPDPPRRPARAGAVGRTGSGAHARAHPVADPAADAGPAGHAVTAVDPNAIARFERPNAPTIAPEITIEPVLEPPAPSPTPSPAPTPTPVPRRPRWISSFPSRSARSWSRCARARGAQRPRDRRRLPRGARPVPAHRHAPHARRRRVRRGHAGHARAGARPRRWRDGRRLRRARDALGNSRRRRRTCRSACSTPAPPAGTRSSPLRRAGSPASRRSSCGRPPSRRTSWPRGSRPTASRSPLRSPSASTTRSSPRAGPPTPILALQAPVEPGTYLLLLDVLTPESGPMSALGGAPAIVRVTVNAAAPTPTVDPTPVAPQR